MNSQMAYKKRYVKIGTLAGENVYFYHGQKIEIGNRVLAARQNDFENSLPFQRRLKKGQFYNNIFQRYRIDDINDRVIFLSL